MCSFLGHYILWKGGIQDGDISVSNLMHRNGTGVLNDFDLARLATPGHVHPRGFDRTGTTPFLSLDLLTSDAQAGKVERRYRHDLESFLWVLMWITACYDNGVVSIPGDHHCWLDEKTSVCLAMKTHMLQVEIVTTNSYLLLEGVTEVLRSYWQNFYFQQSRERLPLKFATLKSRRSGNSGASSSKPVVVMELPDKQVLFNLLQAFTSHPEADYLRSDGLMDDLPLTLFPANFSPLST
jgi:hypothetical protein